MPFTSFGLHADILKGIKDLAFTRPTPIQAESIPPALLGKDVLACAQTGSGKTAAFLLPTMHKLLSHPVPTRMTRVLVITPTRELASQILENLNDLGTHTPLTGAVIVGGVAMGPQEHAFRSNVDILIATPGRLIDHLRRPYAKLNNIQTLILDEADRMLDMGFLPDIKKILKLLPGQKQTLFFSATMPNEIRSLTRELLKDPVTIQIDRQSQPAMGITQAVYPVPQQLKSALLLELLKNEELNSVIVFTRTKHRANRLSDQLRRHKVNATAIHSNRTMAQRNAALAGFKAGQHRVLVATDIAARGIDVDSVSHVINFDVPNIPDDYIHRVGRTGRASKTGDAFTFISIEEEGELRSIERAIGKRLPRITLPDFDYKAKPEEKLEVPIAERIAAIRSQKSHERQRSQLKNQNRSHPSLPMPPHNSDNKPRPFTPQGQKPRHQDTRPLGQGAPGGGHSGSSGHSGSGFKKKFTPNTPRPPRHEGGGWSGRPSTPRPKPQRFDDHGGASGTR